MKLTIQCLVVFAALLLASSLPFSSGYVEPDCGNLGCCYHYIGKCAKCCEPGEAGFGRGPGGFGGGQGGDPGYYGGGQGGFGRGPGSFGGEQGSDPGYGGGQGGYGGRGSGGEGGRGGGSSLQGGCYSGEHGHCGSDQGGDTGVIGGGQAQRGDFAELTCKSGCCYPTEFFCGRCCESGEAPP